MIRKNFSSVILLLIILLAALAAYWPVSRHGFVYDDVQYITGNEHVKGGLSPGNIVWAFTTTYAANWHPLTWLSHMLDIEIFGLAPGGHHLTSLLLHIMNGALLFLLFRSMTGATWRSAAVAGLFLLHPLHVESVAWISERKDVLSTFFGLLTVLAYVRYARRGGWRSYMVLVVLYAMGLMAKPMLVSLPLVLVLLDYWPLRRTEAGWRRSLLEKAPLAALAVISGLLTYEAQAREGAVQLFEQYPFFVRLGNAVVAYVEYLWKGIWPFGLAVFYPHPGRELAMWKVAGAAAILSGATAAAVAWGRKRPYAAVGWFWYVGTLVPVIGLVQVGAQAMADRYTYVPLVGIFVAAVWWLADMTAVRRREAMILGVVTGVLLMVLGAVTRVQVGHWRNDRSLFEHALQVTAENWYVHNNLAGAFSKEGKFDQAAYHYRKASELNPLFRAEALFQQGEELFFRWNFREAIKPYQEALRLNPDYPEALMKLGLVYFMLGQKDEAFSQYHLLKKLHADKARELLGYIGDTNKQ